MWIVYEHKGVVGFGVGGYIESGQGSPVCSLGV